MASILGTAKNVEFTELGAFSRFFRNNSVIFSVAPDEPFILPDGRTLDLVPVRLDCFLKSPSFDDLAVEVVGEYDNFDGMFRADAVEVKKFGLKLGGTKYFDLLTSIACVLVYLALIYFLIFAREKLSTSNSLDPSSNYVQVAAIALSIAFVLVAIVGGVYVKRVAVVVIAEKCNRLLRRVTEYPTATVTTLAVVEVKKTAIRRVQRLVNAVFLLVVLVGAAVWIVKPYVERAFYRFAYFRPHVLSREAERMLNPLSTFRECAKDCPEMVVIPSGSFLMGSPEDEADRADDEGPQHRVTIAKPFAAGKVAVTSADWDACVSQGGCPAIFGGSYGREKEPIVNVSWDDAQLYVAWLSQMTGKPYRLLSEAEWEYAARAGSMTVYYWGDTIGEGNAICSECGNSENEGGILPVGSLKPNAFGLYDMAGNVSQWVEDCFHNNYEGAPADGSVWTSGNCSSRGFRGGGWDAVAAKLRSASRDWDSATERGAMSRGFRVGRTLNRE